MTQPVTRLRPFQSSAQPHLHQSWNSHTRFGFIPIQKHRFCASPQQTLLPKPCTINKAPAHTQKGPEKKRSKILNHKTCTGDQSHQETQCSRKGNNPDQQSTDPPSKSQVRIRRSYLKSETDRESGNKYNNKEVVLFLFISVYKSRLLMCECLKF